MKGYFTICSNNYLAYAGTLYRSVKRYDPAIPFFLFLCDEPAATVDYSTLADEVIPLAAIEPAMNELAARYNIIELNTCVKPRVFDYLLQERSFDQVIYLDPDIQLFDTLASVDDALKDASILLTPHIYTPIPLDGLQPAESLFLNFGLYNLGFLAVRKDAEVFSFLRWWKERTYKQGFIDVYNGIFVDQLPVNLVPLFFKGVLVLQDRGLNMAPWNLHERHLTRQGDGYLVNGESTLKFYHFSSFNTDEIALPTGRYNRYTLAQRPDLLPLYQQYAAALMQAGHDTFRSMPYAYHRKRKASPISRLLGRK